MPTLGERQREFTFLMSRLIAYAYQEGYELSLGEAWRTKEQQALYVQQGKSQTMNSKHLTRLAVDLNLFKDGKYLQRTEDHQALGEYWESLHPACRWGGRWSDGNHYEMVRTP